MTLDPISRYGSFLTVVCHYIYPTDKLCFIQDDGKYMNHSTQPNCITDMKTGHTYALRDIQPTEQFFEDYARFEHPAFLFSLLEKYQCAPDYYHIPEDAYPLDIKLRSTCLTIIDTISVRQNSCS